jgi:Tol biopolymer transport system component
MTSRSIKTGVWLGCLLCTALARADQSGAIFTMNLDGSDARRVVYIEAFPELAAPRWSHDGARLAFEARGLQQPRALVVDVNGRNLIDLGAGARPDWSPDDKQLLFELRGDEQAGVWVQNANGKGHTWLCRGAAPRWSPDGSRMAIGSPLRVRDLLRGDEQELFAAGDHVDDVLGYDWSPDGKQLAVVLKRADAVELVLVQADGGRTLSVRSTGELRGAPAWSPDGRFLAVTQLDARLKQRRICVLPVAGDDPPLAIPGQEGDNYDPAWSPDGKRLAFASTRTSPDGS